MKPIFLFFLVLPFFSRSFADESVSNDQLMDQMRTQMLAEQIETDYKNPKKPSLDDDRAVRGDRNAPIQIFAYSDFQCPFCKKGEETVEEVRKKYGKQVLYVFKNFPLAFHQYAMAAAKRFEAIALQSPAKAYKFHDYVFKNQEDLESRGEAFLDSAAKVAGANLAKMKKEMESEKVKARIAADTSEAQGFEFQGTPGFMVAGVALKGAYPASIFEQIIDRRLADASQRKVTSKSSNN